MSGIKSIFYVLDPLENKVYQSTIKGKILDTEFAIKNRKELSPLVVGDRVKFEKIDNKTGRIISRDERKNEFRRLKNNGREIQTIVANLDYLIIVDSIETPPLRPFFIDRCILSADYMKIPILIVFNKIDLLNENNIELYKIVKNTYKNLNIETIDLSVVTNIGIDKLKEKIKDKLCSFNGRSGVGKSSIIKKIDERYNNIKTGELNKKFNRGRHTTTFSQVYPLSFGGYIIDTPGIRELAVYIDKPDDVEAFFRDFDKFRADCKFPTCQHIDEPDCKVLKALEDGMVEEFRYESYIRIRETIQKISDSEI